MKTVEVSVKAAVMMLLLLGVLVGPLSAYAQDVDVPSVDVPPPSQPSTYPSVPACAGVSDADNSKECCRALRYIWAKSGEASAQTPSSSGCGDGFCGANEAKVVKIEPGACISADETGCQGYAPQKVITVKESSCQQDCSDAQPLNQGATATACGNFVCEKGEQGKCIKDCGRPVMPFCGDGVCGSDKAALQECRNTWHWSGWLYTYGQQCFQLRASTCVADCGNLSLTKDSAASCGNKVCEAGERASSCADCGPARACGDNVCEKEEAGNCFKDCAPVGCGNKICEQDEAPVYSVGSCGPLGCSKTLVKPASCLKDCQGAELRQGTPNVCGNLVCEGTEPATCRADCGTAAPSCGNNACEAGEKYSCPKDCGLQGPAKGWPLAGVNSQFVDSQGERKAPPYVKLLPNQEVCIGDDAGEDFFARARDCQQGTCQANSNDVAACDKASDCVFNGKCYSDIDIVAATFFGGDKAAAWNSPWKSEVAADLSGTGALKLCDPGQWQGPAGTISGTAADSASGAAIAGAQISVVGTSNRQLQYSASTGNDGAFTISSVVPANYDVSASKSGYNSQSNNNLPVLPFQTTTASFQLTPVPPENNGGAWLQPLVAISGKVRNITAKPVQNAAVRIAGTSFTATTAADGTYTISSVPSGTYDMTASKPSDGYSDAAALGVDAVSGAVNVDFTLLLSLGECTNECTKAGSSTCDASCDGKGTCKFYSAETKQACDGTFGIVGLSGGRQVSCCEGQPYTPQKADVTVKAKQIIKTVKPVLYQGKLVNLVTLLFIPDKQG